MTFAHSDVLCRASTQRSTLSRLCLALGLVGGLCGMFSRGQVEAALSSCRSDPVVVVNGATAKLYLDDLFGAEVSFPFGQGLTFGFGSYVDEAGNIVRGYFDNARITGGSVPVGGRLSAGPQGGNVVISWTSTGVLQFTDSLLPANWQDVTPAPAGNSITVNPATQGGTRFYRLR